MILYAGAGGVTSLPSTVPAHRIPRIVAWKNLRIRDTCRLDTRPTATLFYEAIVKSSMKILQLLRAASAVTSEIAMMLLQCAGCPRSRSAPTTSSVRSPHSTKS